MPSSALDLEVKQRASSTDLEVVLLEALDEDALRRTHGRYFANLSQLAESPK